MLFTIIIPHYDTSIKTEDFERCIMSLTKQKYKNFQTLIYHDGPLTKPLSPTLQSMLKELNTVINIEPYKGVWGHNNRDKGIREAIGEYIIHLNSDNVLYELQDIAKYIEETGHKPIYIFPIKMIGVIVLNNGTRLVRTRNPKDAIILNGKPQRYNIDCMQLVAQKSLWVMNGGWYDYGEESDGIIYEAMCKIFPYDRNSKTLIGEHW